MRKLAVLVALAGVMIGLMVWFTRSAPVLTLDELKGLGVVVIPNPSQVTGINLVDQNGELFDSRRLQGRWSFAFFGYTSCPDVCPVTMSVLAQARRVLEARDDPALLAGLQCMLVSVDPERDTPEAMARYVADFSPSFLGVTGGAPDVANFARQVSVGFGKNLVPGSEVGYLMDHSTHIVIIDPDGAFFGYIKPPFDAQKLVHAYRSMAASRSS